MVHVHDYVQCTFVLHFREKCSFGVHALFCKLYVSINVLRG